MEKLMKRTVNAVAAIVPTDSDTYTESDGLQYCLKCHTARECVVEVFGTVRTVPCMCKCLMEAYEREEEASRQNQRRLEIKRYREMGFSEKEMEAWTFAADDGGTPELTKAMKAYVDNFREMQKEGKGLLLYGPVGTGKSFLAACIVNALIDKGYPCLMTNFSRLTNTINSMWEGKQEYIDSLTRFSLIAIDDLGVERDTEYMNESVTTIIDSLYRAKVPVVITSNYTPRQLTEESEIRRSRVYDRLLERCLPVKVVGASRRKQKGRDDFNGMMALLGLGGKQ